MAAPGTRHPGRGTRARARAVTTCELNDPVSKELVGQGRHTKKRATCTAARKCAPRTRALAAGPGTHVGASCVCVAAALNAARSALPDLSDGALQQCTLRRLSVGGPARRLCWDRSKKPQKPSKYVEKRLLKRCFSAIERAPHRASIAVFQQCQSSRCPTRCHRRRVPSRTPMLSARGPQRPKGVRPTGSLRRQCADTQMLAPGGSNRAARKAVLRPPLGAARS